MLDLIDLQIAINILKIRLGDLSRIPFSDLKNKIESIFEKKVEDDLLLLLHDYCGEIN